MKPEHKDLNPTELALLTWYLPDNPLYKNPEHPTVKLAGEIGELLDLWAKDKYKPGFDWLNCKHCGEPKRKHSLDDSECILANLRMDLINPTHYTPLVLDELGDIWYYLRILAWIYDTEFLETKLDSAVSFCIKRMYHGADNILNGGGHGQRRFEICYRLQTIYDGLLELLSHLEYTLEQLTELNYYKLNSEETNHGWKDAR